MLQKDFNGLHGAAAGGQHGILSGFRRAAPLQHPNQKENMALRNVLGQLGIEELWLCCLLVPLNQNLANANLPATLLQGLFHAFPSTDNAGEINLNVYPMLFRPHLTPQMLALKCSPSYNALVGVVTLTGVSVQRQRAVHTGIHGTLASPSSTTWRTILSA